MHGRIARTGAWNDNICRKGKASCSRRPTRPPAILAGIHETIYLHGRSGYIGFVWHTLFSIMHPENGTCCRKCAIINTYLKRMTRVASLYRSDTTGFCKRGSDLPATAIIFTDHHQNRFLARDRCFRSKEPPAHDVDELKAHLYPE